MKKINKKGFTLIELLAVLVILLIIIGIAIPTIYSAIKRTNSKQVENKKQLILATAELYLSDHKTTRKEFYTGTCYIDVKKKLIDGKYIEDEEIIINKERVGNFVVYDNNELKVTTDPPTSPTGPVYECS